MTSKAHVEYDPMTLGLRAAITRQGGAGTNAVLVWTQPAVEIVPEHGGAEPRDEHWLRLPEDDARALYEALAEHFGHAGHDIRTLRRDYEAERRRVDLLIDRVVPTAGAR